MNQAEGDVDKIVWSRFFEHQPMGVFVDVGAASPDFLSVSAFYRSKGWKIIAIEPNPDFAELHRQKGHDVLQYACGERDEDGVEFSVADSHQTPYANGNVSYESFSSLSLKPSYAKIKPDHVSLRQIRVNIRRLDTILQTQNTDRVDIISADVEGWELEVLSGLSFERYAPRVLIIENLHDDDSYRKFLKARGYGLWRFIYPNDVYVPQSEITAMDRIACATQRTAHKTMAKLRSTRR